MDKSRIAISVFDRRAKEYEAKYMDISQYKASLGLFASLLPKPNASVLEVACGPGNVTHYLLEQHPQWQMLCTDLAPNMISIARKANPAADFRLLDAREIKALHQQFDAVVCGFLFPYLSKEEALQFIQDAAATLVSGGALYLSTIEGPYGNSDWVTSSYGDKVYMYYHEEEYLVQQMEKCGFKVLHVLRTDVDLVLIGQIHP